jgi:hypothetical protein
LLARWPASAAELLEGTDKAWDWDWTQRARIRDHHGVELAPFLDAPPRMLETPVEDREEWALAVPYSPQWAALRRVCRLRLFLEQHAGDVIHPKFETLLIRAAACPKYARSRWHQQRGVARRG